MEGGCSPDCSSTADHQGRSVSDVINGVFVNLLICYFPMWRQHLLAYHTLPKGDKIVLLKSPCFNVTMVSQRDAIRIEMQQQVGAASSNMMTSGSSTSELRPRQRCSTLPDPSRRFPNLHGEAGGGAQVTPCSDGRWFDPWPLHLACQSRKMHSELLTATCLGWRIGAAGEAQGAEKWV